MKKTTSKVRVGEKILDRNKAEVFIQKPCEEKNKGRWYCVTHKELFENQLQKDCHVDSGKHKLAWLCFKHGFERP